MKNASEKVKKPIPHKKVIVAVVLIITAFFGSYLVYFILQVSLNTESPIVVVISGSMEPNIHTGDLLFIAGIDPEDIKNGTAEDKNGDVIVFNARDCPGWLNAPQEPIVHRVVDKKNISDTWYFKTKGDANTSEDPVFVPEGAIIGVVIGGIPYIGWVKIFLTNSGLLIPLLVVISALLIVSIVRDVIKGEPEEESKETKKNKKDMDTQPQEEE